MKIFLVKIVKNIMYSNEDMNLKKAPKFQRDKNKCTKILIKLTHILILYLLILPLVVETNQRTLQDYSSYIILKTNGTGNISIFSNLYSGEYPNEIQVMRENTWISVTNDVQRGYYFDNSQNNINSFRLSWNNEIT